MSRKPLRIKFPGVMSNSPLWRIKFLAGIDRKQARAEYAKHFGRTFNASTIDKELHQVVRQHRFDAGDGRIAVPEELMLALFLRPTGKGYGKKRPPLEPWLRRIRVLVVRTAENGWARRVKDDGRKVSKKAKHEEAVKAHAEIKGHGLSVDTIKRKMSLARGKRYISNT